MRSLPYRLGGNGTQAFDVLTDTITLACDSCRISELRMSLDITHTYRGDLYITLTSPGNTEHTIHSISDDSGNNIRFSDRVISAFNGEQASGVWTLFIQDQCAQDTGTLNSWSLSVTCA